VQYLQDVHGIYSSAAAAHDTTGHAPVAELQQQLKKKRGNY